MSTEAVAVLEMPAVEAPKRKRGRRAAEEKAANGAQVLFYLAERTQGGHDLVLGEKFETEGHAIIESLKRDVPFYRVEIWKSRAMVKDGAVEIKKEPVSAEVAEAQADGFRKTNR
jgi:hypothetical protein